MKFENTEVWGFEHALRGMRNPMNSWDKSDSQKYNSEDCSMVLNNCDSSRECSNSKFEYCIGKNDMALAQKLIRAGSEHRKFMRQIFVSVDITAPMYWWKEFDTYKVGTVANSTSTMHKLATTPITLDCFEMDSITEQSGEYPDLTVADCVVNLLENYRQEFLRTNDKRVWKVLVQLLPESWLQTRTVTMNYENLLAMCSKGQRRFHKLNEWSGIDNPSVPNFISWARTLPYAKELIFLDEYEGDRK